MEQTQTKGIYLYAMEYALYFGLILITKMVLAPYTGESSVIRFLFSFFLIIIPVAGYLLTKRFRNISGYTKFSQIFIFGILMYFFASLLSGIFDYVYYQYINQQFFQEQIELMNTLLQSTFENTADISEEAKSVLPQTPIELVFNSIWGMLIMGVLYAAVVALFLRKKQTQTINLK